MISYGEMGLEASLGIGKEMETHYCLVGIIRIRPHQRLKCFDMHTIALELEQLIVGPPDSHGNGI